MLSSCSTHGAAASFLAQKRVDCCLMQQYFLACLFVQLPFFIRLLAMFGLSCSKWLFACVDSASQQYFFIHLLAMFGPWAPKGYLLTLIPLFGLAALSPHGNIPLSLWPCPLMAIFLWPCGLAPSRRYLVGLVATPPHSKIDFLFASWQMSWQMLVLFFLRPLTVKLIFYLPHVKMSILLFFCLLAAVFHLHLTV